MQQVTNARDLPGRLAGGLVWALGAVVAIGLLLRVAASFQSFWLDEIWSYYLAQDLGSLWEIVSERKHDNNHILNTLFIALVGEHENWFVYRVLSVVTGTASLWLLLGLARERGWADALAVAVLAAVSYPLVVASAQARGYAPAIFFSLLAVRLLRNFWASRSTAVLVAFWLACALGMLSHLTFLYAYLSLVAWTALRALGESSQTGGARGRLSRAAVEMARCHALPLALFALLYASFYSQMVIGGGPSDYNVLVVVRRVIASSVGLATSGAPAVWATAAAVAILLSGLVVLERERTDEWLFFLCVLIVVPGFVLVAMIPRLFYARYLWASIPFFYLLAAFVLAWLYRSSRLGKLIYAAALVGFTFAHVGQSVDLLSLGRTNYSDALTYLEEHTDGDVIELGSDHDFRNEMVVRFYARHRTAGKRFAFRKRRSWSGPGPQWYLMHSWSSGPNPPEHITLDGHRRYTRVARFDHGVEYGWDWFIYRNDAR